MTEKDPALTMTGDIVGTLRYMSPEQALGDRRQMDHRTDIYSLGVTLYELLTLQPALAGDKRETLVRRLLEDDPPRPRTVDRAIPKDLETIVLKAAAKEPQQRYATAQEMADDLKRFLANEPIRARRPTVADRAAKWARRHQPLVWSAVALVAMSAIGLAASTFLIAREQTKTAEAYQGEKEQRELADEQKSIAQEQKRNAQEQERLAVKQKGIAEHQKQLAVKQQQLADLQKAEAVRQRDTARQNLYYADMRLALVDIAHGNVGRARDGVLSHVPAEGEPDRRAWEWYYVLGWSHEAEQVLYGHRSEVFDIAWSPNGNSIASVSSDGSARVWDTKTWKLVRRFDHGGTFKCGVGWSPDSQKLAWGSCSAESALRIWDRQRDTVSVLMGHQSSIWAVPWSHDGRYVAAGGIPPGNVRIWDVGKNKCIREMAPTGGNVGSIAWSPDDRLLAATCHKSGLLVWDVSSGDTVCRETKLKASCVSWHPSEARLAVGNKDGECLIWDQVGRKTVSRWKAHLGEVSDIAWAADGRRLLSAGRDGIVKVCDAEGREHKSVAAHAGSAKSVAWDPTGRRFASSGTDGVIRIWSVENRPNPLVIHTKLQGTLDLAWDHESTCLLLASGGAGKIVAWDASSGKSHEEVPLRQDENRRLVSFRYVAERSRPPAAEARLLKVPGTTA